MQCQCRVITKPPRPQRQRDVQWYTGLLFKMLKGISVMVFYATYNNISAISWRSVLFGKETRGPGEEHRPTASNWQTLSHNVVSSTSCNERESNTQLLRWDALIAWVVVIPTIIRSQPRHPQYWKGAHLQIHYYTTYCRLWFSIITNIEITSKSYTNYTKI